MFVWKRDMEQQCVWFSWTRVGGVGSVGGCRPVEENKTGVVGGFSEVR